MKFIAAMLLLAFPLAASAAQQGTASNHFASVYIDGDKVGQVHVTRKPGPADDAVEVTTHASMSVLGVEVFQFSQDLRETWKGDKVVSVHGQTDDDGTKYTVELKRMDDGLVGSVNGKSVTFPADAYPSSFWQYAITKAHRIIDLKDLSVYKVTVKRRDETITIDGHSIATERFDFTGGWVATLWFDKDHHIVQFDNKVRDHDVKVVLDR